MRHRYQEYIAIMRSFENEPASLLLILFIFGSCLCVNAMDCPDTSSLPPCPDVRFPCSGFKPHLATAYHVLKDGTECPICPICVDSLEECPIVALARSRLFKRFRVLEPGCDPVILNIYVNIAGERCFAGELFECRRNDGEDESENSEQSVDSRSWMFNRRQLII